jgi:hypothetical protein
MSSPGNWIRKFLNRSISRRDFVEHAAYGGLGVSATTAVLSFASHEAHAEGPLVPLDDIRRIDFVAGSASTLRYLIRWPVFLLS